MHTWESRSLVLYDTVAGGGKFALHYKKYHPDEQWYFADKMQPHEALMIKSFDLLRM